MRFSEYVLMEIGKWEFEQGKTFMESYPFFRDNAQYDDGGTYWEFSDGSKWTLHSWRNIPFWGKRHFQLLKGKVEVKLSDFDKRILLEAWALANELMESQKRQKKADKIAQEFLAAYA